MPDCLTSGDGSPGGVVVPGPDLLSPALLANPFHIAWGGHTIGTWQRLLRACYRPTLSQTWQYAAARARTSGETAENGIIHFHGRPVGLVQTRILHRLGPLVSAALDRGPLWIYPQIPAAMHKLALRQLRRRYRPWRGRSLVFRPELADTPDHRAQLQASGFVRTPEPGYRTVWLDLRVGIAALRRGLQQKWRNRLNRAERRGLTVDDRPAGFDWLLPRLEAAREQGGFRGPGPVFLHCLREARMLRVLVAHHPRHGPVAGIVLARHGRAATWLAGWNGPTGRGHGAHNLLLWYAIATCRESGIDWLDLGGLAGKASLDHFKTGPGGTTVTLAGAWR